MRVTISRIAPQKLEAAVQLLPEETGQFDHAIDRLNGKPLVLYFKEGDEVDMSHYVRHSQLRKVLNSILIAVALLTGMIVYVAWRTF